jgi:hypothetical protein
LDNPRRTAARRPTSSRAADRGANVAVVAPHGFGTRALALQLIVRSVSRTYNSVMRDVELPPVVQIVLEEEFPESLKPGEVKRYFRRLLPELRQQANWTRENFRYIDDGEVRPTGFTVTASGTLNPLAYRDLPHPVMPRSRGGALRTHGGRLRRHSHRS